MPKTVKFLTQCELGEVVLKRLPFPVLEAQDKVQFEAIDANVSITLREAFRAKIADGNLVPAPIEVSPDNPSPVLVLAEGLSLVETYNSGHWSVAAKDLNGDDLLVILSPPVGNC